MGHVILVLVLIAAVVGGLYYVVKRYGKTVEAEVSADVKKVETDVKKV